MDIQSTDIICGVPAKSARGVVRDIHNKYDVTTSWFQERCQKTYGIEKPLEFVQRLLDAGYVEQDPFWPGEQVYILTALGRRLGATAFVKRMDRATADKLMRAVITRASQYENLYPTNPRVLTSVAVFGSYTTDASSIGDLDLILDIEWKPEYQWIPHHKDGQFEKTQKAAEDFADEYGPASLDYWSLFDYSAQHIARHIKNRSPLISISTRSAFDAFDEEQRQKYAVVWTRGE